MFTFEIYIVLTALFVHNILHLLEFFISTRLCRALTHMLQTYIHIQTQIQNAQITYLFHVLGAYLGFEIWRMLLESDLLFSKLCYG